MRDTKTLLNTFEYSPLTGGITWRVHEPRNKKRKGDPAGREFASREGLLLQRHNNTISGHDFAYLSVVGEMPTKRVWHKNGNPLDNRWSNLTLEKPKAKASKAKSWGDMRLGSGGGNFCAGFMSMALVSTPTSHEFSPRYC